MKGPGSIPVGFARRKLAFAYRPKRVRDVFSPDQLRQLALLCDICDVAPLESFEDSRAADILSDVEILMTGWGCPRIDRAVLKFAPRLQMIPHAAGTVKSFVAPEVSEAGIVVTNAASANAIPVAEFSLAAILFANKKVLGFAEL